MFFLVEIQWTHKKRESSTGTLSGMFFVLITLNVWDFVLKLDGKISLAGGLAEVLNRNITGGPFGLKMPLIVLK